MAADPHRLGDAVRSDRHVQRGGRGQQFSHGSLFINTFLFWVGPIEHFVTRTDRLTWRKALGLLIAGVASFGVLATDAPAESARNVAPRDEVTLYGDLILLVSGLMLGIKIVYTKHAVRTVEPGKLIFWHDVFGTALFLAYSLALETTRAGDFTTPGRGGSAYQGILVGGLCFAIQALQLKHHSASQIAVFSASTPVVRNPVRLAVAGRSAELVAGRGDPGVAWGILLVTRQSIFRRRLTDRRNGADARTRSIPCSRAFRYHSLSTLAMARVSVRCPCKSRCVS